MSNNTNNNENHHLIHSSIGNTRPESETENGSITGSCEHLSELRSKFGSNPFRNFPNCVKVKPFGRASILRDPELIHCGACEKSPPHAPLRLFACVTCAKVFCNVHARSHAPDSDPSLHNIAMDVSRAELYCGACGDQVYDRDFDAAIVLAQTEARGEEAGSRGSHAPENTPKRRRVECKRRRVEYKPWTPDVNEQVLIVGNSSPFPSQIVTNDETTTITQELVQWGLRGLNNLGNTCFMNSVLQALLHTPPLRNYFLSDKHNRYYCQRKNSSVVTRSSSGGGVDGANKNNNSMLCLACDLDAMFSAVFSGNRTPISPAKFLYSWWKHASNLASYEQQDAHEFFISVLDGIHERLQNDKGKAQSPGSGDCCIAHRVFSGILRSDVMCTACGFTSTTYDPCIDISLDLELSQGSSTKMTSKKSHKKEAEPGKSSQNGRLSTLRGCLDHFTRPEKLGSDQKFFCQHCQVRQESLKQMSIRKLPLVSCFHIKRFEHSVIKKMSRKVDHYLQFPFSLDMSPYLSSSILRSRFGNRIFSFDGDEQDTPCESSSEFELFAVITHTGKLDAGHYVTYLRLSNQWYKCDDAWITQVSENIVRAAQGYMMFYVQKMLYYKASEKQG